MRWFWLSCALVAFILGRKGVQKARRSGRIRAAVHVLRGRPLIFGVKMIGPLRLHLPEDVVISNCEITIPRPAQPSAFGYDQ